MSEQSNLGLYIVEQLQLQVDCAARDRRSSAALAPQHSLFCDNSAGKNCNCPVSLTIASLSSKSFSCHHNFASAGDRIFAALVHLGSAKPANEFRGWAAVQTKVELVVPTRRASQIGEYIPFGGLFLRRVRLSFSVMELYPSARLPVLRVPDESPRA